MMLITLSLLSCSLASSANTFPPDVTHKFEEFVAKWGKNYDDNERDKRLAIFAENLKIIQELQRVEQGTAKYSYLSPFADISTGEFSKRNGYRPVVGLNLPIAPMLSARLLEDGYNWRDHGAVNPIKDQGDCGSCWAFSTVANIEGAGFVSTGKLVSLSEQELVDCDRDFDDGCDGGLPEESLKWMTKAWLGSREPLPIQSKESTMQSRCVSRQCCWLSEDQF